jgi:hypothetical protein
VWIYGEKYRWWPTQDKRVKPQGWEDVLPGINDALYSTTHPRFAVEQQLAKLAKEENLVNQLQNGDFSAALPNAVPPKNVPGDWGSVGAPAHWSTWQTKKSHGTFAQDNNMNHDNSKGGAARIAGVENGCFIQSFNVKPGETYAVRAWVRQTGNGIGWLRIGWQMPDGKWTEGQSDVTIYKPKAQDKDTWQEITGIAHVPNHAGKLVVLLCAGIQPGPQDVIWYDDVRVYKVQ